MPKKEERIIVTVMGADKVGIVAGVSSILAECKANILDLTSTKMRDLFVMIMLVDITESHLDARSIQEKLRKKGEELGVQVSAQHEDIFRFMHRV